MRYDIFVAVWGEHYVDKFLDFSLASQLTPGNLPALYADAEIVYRIYTDRSSRPFFNRSLPALQSLAEVEFIYYEDMPYGGATLAEAMANSDPSVVKHNVQKAAAQHHVALAAAEGETAAMLLDSDFIFADGALGFIHQQRQAGKKAVTGMFLRLSEEGAGPALRRLLPGPLDARALVQLGLEHMHPIQRAMFAGRDHFAAYPSQINWAVGGDEATFGFVTHCFFPHPLMFELGGGAFSYMSTMDYEVVLRAAAEDADIHVCRSSDDMLFCKMSPESYLAGQEPGTSPTVEQMARFVISNTNIRHRLFMEAPVRYVAQPDEEAFGNVETASAEFVEAVYKTVEFTFANQSNADPKTLMFVKSFLGPIENFISPQVHARMKGWMEG